MNRKEHWEKVYSDKSPMDVSWYQSEPEISLELIAETGCSKDAAIIDVGGGASVLADRLLENGYRNIAVLDLSGKALAYAKKRLGAQSATVDWFESDVTEFLPPNQYDVWHDRAVFHFLTDAMDRRKYIDTLKRTVRKGGHVIFAAFAIGGPEKCSGLDIVQYDARKIAAELGDAFSLISERHEVHSTPSGGKQNFQYFHFVKDA
ncbi:MAG TPA: class I SAM-dependent methyltransferase [Mariprofundaceae bacterium]|nr:class I SAM-dependent methyltransferase [Mariprofundaceae bacterium]